jgi:hypothetical protein
MKKKAKILLILSSVLLFLLLSFIGLFIYEYIRITPKDVYFTNVTSNSVTVSWSTKNRIPMSVMVRERGRGIPIAILDGTEKFFDTRDVKYAELLAVQETADNVVENNDLTVSIDDFQTEVEVTQRGEYYTHHVTVTGLNPETEYSFLVGDRYIFREVSDSKGSTTAKTLVVPEEIRSPVPAYGSVKDAENQENTPIDNLTPITDGVIYFNYWDEVTNERSAVYSSSFNSDGNWYMDVSNAVGEDGKHFISRFEDTVTNLYVELTIDAGPLGTWKKVLPFNDTSPTDVIVLNDPLMIQDAKLGIERLDSMLQDELVKGVEAGACLFMEYCGPCYDGVLTNRCSCSKGALEERGCSGESRKSLEDVREGANKRAAGSNNSGNTEGGITCSESSPLESYVLWGDKCKKCVLSANEEYGVWETQEGDSYCEDNGVADGHVSVPVEEQLCWRINNRTCELFTYTGDKPNCGANYVSRPECVDFLRAQTPSSTPQQTGQQTETKIVATTGPCANKLEEDGCRIGGGIGRCTADGVCEPITLVIDEPYEGNPEEESKETEYCNKNVNKPLYRGTGPTRERCVNGEWILDPENEDNTYYNIECKLGNSCTPSFFPRWRCITSEGDVLICKASGLRNDDDYEQAVIRDPVTKGQLCKDPDGCLCTSAVMSSEPINIGQYCPNVNDYHCATLNDIDGKVCSTSSDKYICNDGECVLESDVKGVSTYLFNKEDKNLIENFIPTVHASSKSYILDPKTGYIQGLESGMYTFEYEDQTYTFTVEPWQEEITVYIDKNGNGEYDSDVDVLASEIANQINIVTVSQTYDYQLTKGLNFISFPFLISGEEYRTAAGLLHNLNEIYNDTFYSISKFDGRWKIVGQNTDMYDNDDFQLLPGEGYMIKSKEDIDISIVGQPIQFETETDQAPINLNQGWNLIGLYGTNIKTYTAKSLIEDINTDDFTADNVTKWATDKQLYEGLQISDGEEYGFDFPLNKLESYFVRITQGNGNWQPSLGGNN